MKPKQHETPEFSEVQYEYLRKVFQRASITPDTSTNQLMYSAGEQHVLDFIGTKVKAWARQRVGPS